MAYIQHNAPRNERLNFKINNFSGGINNVDTKLQPNELRDMVNFDFHEKYALKRRPGLVVNTAFGASPISNVNFMDSYEPYTGSPYYMLSSDSQRFLMSSSGNGQIKSGRMFSGLNHKGMYIYASSTGLRVYMLRSMIPSPSTYVQYLGEMPSDAVFDMKIRTPHDGYIPNDKTHTQGNVVFDFSEMSVQYQPCLNELEDPYKGFNVIPDSVFYLAQLGGRIYASGSANAEMDELIYITDPVSPFYFPAGMGLQLPPNSDAVNGMHTYDDGVVVFREHDIHIVRGVTNNPSLGLEMYKVQQLNTPTGLIKQYMFAKTESYLFYMGTDFNVYALSSTTYDDRRLNVQKITKNVDLRLAPFELDMGDMLVSKAMLQSCAYHNRKFYIFTASQTIVYDFDHMAWYRYTGELIRTSVTLMDGTFVLCSNGNSICKYDTSKNPTYRDFNHDYVSSIRTDDYDLGSEFHQKLMKFGHVTSEIKDPENIGTFKFIFDDNDTVPFMNYRDVGGVFGTTYFGESVFGTGDRIVSKRINFNRRFRRFRVEFESSYNDSTSIFEFDFEYELRGRS